MLEFLHKQFNIKDIEERIVGADSDNIFCLEFFSSVDKALKHIVFRASEVIDAVTFCYLNQDVIIFIHRRCENNIVFNIRRDANDKVKADKKNSVMTEDEAKQSDKLVQDLTDKYIKEIDTITNTKTKEIMEI